jgi:hypothetical protein
MALETHIANNEMGLGEIATANFKRKYRWTLKIERQCKSTGQDASVPPSFVKLASRPNISIEETEINYLHGKRWLPGKGTWETITVTYYDVISTDEGTVDSSPLLNWLAAVYMFYDPIKLHQATRTGDYAGTGKLVLYDGCGNPVELWTLSDMWPTAINWGDLDYSNSEEVTIELTLRYSKVTFDSCKYTKTPCCGSACQ